MQHLLTSEGFMKKLTSNPQKIEKMKQAIWKEMAKVPSHISLIKKPKESSHVQGSAQKYKDHDLTLNVHRKGFELLFRFALLK